MTKRNLISSTLLALFLVIITSFGKFNIAKSFQWELFLISISAGIINLCIDINFYSLSENNKDVMIERYRLYKIIQSKSERIDDVIEKIMKSRNDRIVLATMPTVINKIDCSYETLEEMIAQKKLLGTLLVGHSSKKQISLVKRLIKNYNRNDDLYEIVRSYDSRELISHTAVNVSASLIGVISFILAIFAFFKMDISTITPSFGLLFVAILIVINMIDTIESYREIRLGKIAYYVELQSIFENECIK